MHTDASEHIHTHTYTKYSFITTAVNLSALAWGQCWIYRRGKQTKGKKKKRGQKRGEKCRKVFIEDINLKQGGSVKKCASDKSD